MLAIVMILASIVSAVSYPSAVAGQFLYDKAGKLSEQEFADLNKRLTDYQAATTNEIAVVTTQDLQGQSINEYAKGLFNEWGVGRRDVNNGVLILLSLDSDGRGVWIQPGDGVDNDIDEESIANVMIPHFKNQQWAKGLNAGVDAVMESMPRNWPAAASTAAAQSSQPYRPTASSSNDGSGGSTIIYIVAAASGLILLLGVKAHMSSRARAKREAEEKAQAAADYRQESVDMVSGLKDLLAKLENSIIPAQTALNKLKDGYTASVWERLVKPFEEISVELLGELKREIEIVEVDAQQNEQPKATRDAIGTLIRRLTNYIQVCDRLDEQLQLAERSKSEAKSALAHMPERIAAAEKEADNPDVGDELRGKLQLVKIAFFERQAGVQGKEDKNVDWVQLNESLKVISGDVAQAVSQARSDKELAQRARIEGPKMLAQMEEIQRQLAEKEQEYQGSRSAQAEIADARAKIDLVQRQTGGDSTDWLQVYLLMDSINNHNDGADRAYRAHVQRIRDEEEATEQRKRNEEASARRRRESSSSTSFSGGHSGSHGGGSSFSGSSFSGGHSGGRGGGGRF